MNTSSQRRIWGALAFVVILSGEVACASTSASHSHPSHAAKEDGSKESSQELRQRMLELEKAIDGLADYAAKHAKEGAQQANQEMSGDLKELKMKLEKSHQDRDGR